MPDEFSSDQFRPFSESPGATPPRRDAAPKSPIDAEPIFAEPVVFEAAAIDPPIGPNPFGPNPFGQDPTGEELVAAEAVEDDAYQLSPADPTATGATDAARAWAIDTHNTPYPRFAANAPQAATPGKPRRRWPLLVGLVVGVPIAGIALIALLGWLFVASATEQPITEKDRDVVMKAEDIVAYVDTLEANPARATIRKVRYLDGSYDVEYEYDSTDRADEHLYVLCTVTVERTVSDARTSYAALGVVNDVGISMASDLKVRPRNELFRWGDSSDLAIVESQHGPVGNIFRARSGRRIFDLTFYGVYFDDADTLAELLTPHLEQMKRYEP